MQVPRWCRVGSPKLLSIEGELKLLAGTVMKRTRSLQLLPSLREHFQMKSSF